MYPSQYEVGRNLLLYNTILANKIEDHHKFLLRTDQKNAKHYTLITGVITNSDDLGIFFDQTSRNISLPQHMTRHDVFDELKDILDPGSQSSIRSTVWSPISVYPDNWKLMEVEISAQTKKISIKVTVHDGTGLAQRLKNKLKWILEQRVKKISKFEDSIEITFHNSKCDQKIEKEKIDGTFNMVLEQLRTKLCISLGSENNENYENNNGQKWASQVSEYGVLSNRTQFEDYRYQDCLSWINELEGSALRDAIISRITDSEDLGNALTVVVKYLESDIPGLICQNTLSEEDEFLCTEMLNYFFTLKNLPEKDNYIRNTIMKELGDKLPITNAKKIQWRNAIGYNSNGQISAIKFNRLTLSEYEMMIKNEFIINKLENWFDLPNFVLITGANGMGKSQVLSYIYENICNDGNLYVDPRKKVVYMKANENFSFEPEKSNRDDPFHWVHHKEKLKQFVDLVLEWIKNPDDTDCDWPFKEAFKIITKRIEKIKHSVKVDQQYVTELTYRTIEFHLEALRIEVPLSFLNHVLNRYEERKRNIIADMDNLSSAITLYEYCQNESIIKETRVKDILNFFILLRENPNLKQNILEEYAESRAGLSPLKELNSTLKQYGFKYLLKPQKDLYYRENNIQLEYINHAGNSMVIDADMLSSGEKMMLTMLSWKYYVQITTDTENYVNEDNKIKIMLLDEPDKHLDPKLCGLFYEIIYKEFVNKENIQVFMVTHRLDTVALAPENSTFLVETDTVSAKIVKVHKLQAMYRMSRNLRGFLDHGYHVFVEDINDKLFHQGAYESLKYWCKIHRTNFSNNYYWNIYPNVTRRYLSNRYQMIFKSAGGKNGGGGSVAVKAKIQGDHKSLLSDTKKKRRLFQDAEVYKSYGIIDNDYNMKQRLDIKGIENYVTVIEKRNSLDNFVYDPIILCSCLPTAEVNGITDKELKTCIISISESIQKLTENCNIELCQTTLQRGVDCYFGIILRKVKEFLDKEFPDSKISETQQKNLDQNEIKNFSNTTNKKKFKQGKHAETHDISPQKAFQQKISQYFSGDREDKDKIKFIGKKIFDLDYPNCFLKLGNHRIEEAFEKLSTGKEKYTKTHMKTICSYVNETNLDLIPLDLADIFFDLDQKLRQNITAVIKPEKLKLAGSSKIDSTMQKQMAVSDLTIKRLRECEDEMQE